MTDLAYAGILEAAGAAARLTNRLRPTIFCFHSVRSHHAASASTLSVSDRFLARLVEQLRHQGIPILPLGEAVDRVLARDLAPFAVLTFDDGYLDNYTTLFPLMRRLGVPFTLFVTTGLVDREVGMWWETLERIVMARGRLADDRAERAGRGADRASAIAAALKAASPAEQASILEALEVLNRPIRLGPERDRVLSWAMIREMHDTGLATIGSHGVHHRMLSALPREILETELAGSRRRIEAMVDARVDFLAYPFGQDWEVGRLAPEAARTAGYRAAFTTEAVPLSADDAARPLQLPRILLSRKVDHPDIALAYMSGFPARFNRLVGRR